ncbi:hypothetical protein AMJ85_02220 [candidate division BRC1 bacterium SM23_51]|nr:MAG: hypothetical protein AMJ85_02220 [candidate division BRC1 bacterium SM23_51]
MKPSVIRQIVGLGLSISVAIGSNVDAGESPKSTTSPTVAAPSPTTGTIESDPVAEKWLRALEERHRDHRRASGEFDQVREDPVFLEKNEWKGRFCYERPSRFRCDYTEPEASTHTVIGNIATSYFPAFKQVEEYRLSREGSGIGEVNHMLLAFGIETDKILKHFVVTNDPAAVANSLRLSFVPKAPPEERPFKQFILEMSEPDLTPKRFEIIGDGDDWTTVVIREIKWNPMLPPETFRLKFPRDVEKIVHE